MEKATDTFKDEVRIAYDRASKLIPNAEIEREFIKRAKNGDITARNTLFEKQLPALIKFASGNRYQVFKGNAAELVARALTVMDNVINDFDLSKGTRFWTFLQPRAMSEMNKEKYKDNLVHVPENYVKENRRDEFGKVESGHSPLKGGDGKTSMFDVLQGDTATTIIEDATQSQYVDITGRLLSALTSDEKEIIDKCFFELEPDEKGLPSNHCWSVSSFARHTGRSKDILARIHRNALAKMKTQLNLDRDWCIDQSVL